MRTEEVYEQNRTEALLIHRSSASTVEGKIGTSVDHLQINLGLRITLFDLTDPVRWLNRNAVWKNEVPLRGDPYQLSGIELLHRAAQLQPTLRDLSEERITEIGQQLFIVAEGLKALNKGEKDRLTRIVQPTTSQLAS
jgi:hypothetical protein